MSYLILGCGYTGRLVAQLLADDGCEVVCANRRPEAVPGVTSLPFDVTDGNSIGALTELVEEGARVLYSIPTVEPAEHLMETIRSRRPERMVYFSTTGVYGKAEQVNETTPPDWQDDRAAPRLRTEQMLSDGDWPTLVLRPAAIYGRDRGVHVSVRQDDYSRAAGWNRVVSRIHAEDLARLAVVALKTSLEGRYPVADDEPCRSIEVAEFAGRLLGKTLPHIRLEAEEGGRRVDGSAIRRLLNVSLLYASYREGVAAAFRDS